MRRFRRTVRAPRKMRWLEGIAQTLNGAGAYVLLDVSTGVHAAGVPSAPVTDIISQGQVENELDGNGTVIRIIGDYSLAFDDAASVNFNVPVLVWLGIKVIDSPPAGAQASWDVSDAGAQDASWMWVRNHALWPANSGAGSLIGLREQVDIKARRKLRQNQAVALYASTAFPFGSTPIGVLMTANMRCLCKLG